MEDKERICPLAIEREFGAKLDKCEVLEIEIKKLENSLFHSPRQYTRSREVMEKLSLKYQRKRRELEKIRKESKGGEVES